MVVFEDGLPRKSEYRRFIVRGDETGATDDTAAMHEVLTRRFRRGQFRESLAEVDVRRRREAVGAAAEEDLIHVQLEDLVLAFAHHWVVEHALADRVEEADITQLQSRQLEVKALERGSGVLHL